MKPHIRYIYLIIAIFIVAGYLIYSIEPKEKTLPVQNGEAVVIEGWGVVDSLDVYDPLPEDWHLSFIESSYRTRAQLDTADTLTIFDPTITVVWDTLTWREK